MAAALICSDTELTIRRPLWTWSAEARIAIEAWLLDHGIRPEKVVVGTTISRDKVRRRLCWFEAAEDGPAPRMFLRFGGPAPEWPSPFPDCLLSRAA